RDGNDGHHEHLVLRHRTSSLAVVGLARGRPGWGIPHDRSRVFRRQHRQDGAGGWVPIAIAAAIFLIMTTWNRGRELLQGILAQAALPLDRLIAEVRRTKPPRVPGTGLFLAPTVDAAPPVLQHHLTYNKASPQEIVLLSITTEEVPEVPRAERVTSATLAEGFYRVNARYGFMEKPDVQDIIAICRERGMKLDVDDT